MKILGYHIRISTIFLILFSLLGIYHFLYISFFLRSAIPSKAYIEGFWVKTVLNEDVSEYRLPRLIEHHLAIPIITFQDLSGKKQKVAKLGYFRTFKQGQNVSILYDPSYPLRSYENSFDTLWSSCIFYFSLSLIIFIWRHLGNK